MLVKLIEQRNLWGTVLPPGAIVCTSDKEAAQLIFDGIAVPVTRNSIEYVGRETR